MGQTENFRRAKFEWQSKFPPGHWALGLQKLPLVRFNLCAWVSQPTAPVRILAGAPRASPTQSQKIFLRIVGEDDSPYQGEMSSAARQRE